MTNLMHPGDYDEEIGLPTEHDFANLINEFTTSPFIPVWVTDWTGTFSRIAIKSRDIKTGAARQVEGVKIPIQVTDDPFYARFKYYKGCRTCFNNLARALAGQPSGGPPHEFSQFCRSGKRPHCTCDLCY